MNTKDCALKGLKLFGSTKWKLDLPPNSNYASQQSNKVNYSILLPNTRGKRACIEESLNVANHGMAHMTLVLETSCSPSNGTLQDYHPTLPKDVGNCRPILGLCAMPKLELANMTTCSNVQRFFFLILNMLYQQCGV